MSIIKSVAGSRNRIKLLTSAVSAVIAATASPVIFAQEVEEVTVTGSRIVRRDFESSSPILTIDSERFEQSSTMSVESVLNQLPQFQPAQTQFSAQGQIQTASDISLGVGTLNLRGVQTNRSLVLIDGRRGQPANAAGIVDTNTIPSAAIERVETITGGASSVYGPDAMAGVVNFVLKDNFEGASIDFQSGITEAGDAEEFRVSTLVGISSGNANVMFGVEMYERKTGFQKNRDFYTDAWEDPNTPRGAVGGFGYFAQYATGIPARFGSGQLRPTQAAVNQAFMDDHGIDVSVPGSPTYVNAASIGQYNFNRDGTIWVNSTGQGGSAVGAIGFDESQLGRQPDTGDGFSGLGMNPDGTVNQVYVDGPMSTPLERRSLFAKGNVDISDNISLFSQANYSRSDVTTFSAGPAPATFGSWGGSIPNDGRAIPSSLQTLLDSRADPDQVWLMQRGLDFIGNFGPRNTSDVYQLLVGLEGSLDRNDWTWEAFFSTGETTTTNLYPGLPSVARYQALVEAPNWGQGASIPSVLANNYQIRCESGLPIFDGGLDTITRDCVTSILGGSKSTTNLTQDIFEANLQGMVMELPAGEMRFAAGISHRKNTFSYDPANAEGAIFDVPLGIFSSNPTTGSTKVGEVYGELLIPVLETLDLEVGYRYSDFDSGAGEVGTYKILAGWEATDWLTIRGGYNLANRAPNIAELYSAPVSNFQGAGLASGDPCSVNTLADGWGNTPDNPKRLDTQRLCQTLIGNDSSNFGVAGSVEANTFGIDNPIGTGLTSLISGNPNLVSEEGETWTVGAVFSAPFGIEGLVGSIDWYQIEITDAIAQFTGTEIYRGCFNADGISNPTLSANDPQGFCNLILRAETGGLGTVNVAQLNTGYIKTAGFDLSVNYSFDVPWGGSGYVNTVASILDTFVTQTSLSTAPVEWAGTLAQGGQYDWRLNSTVGYMFPDINASIGLRMRYLPSIHDGSKAQNPDTTIWDVDSYAAFDLFGSYTFGDNYQLRGGIDNVFEADPSLVGRTATNARAGQTNAGFYDVLGRRYYLGLTLQF